MHGGDANEAGTVAQFYKTVGFWATSDTTTEADQAARLFHGNQSKRVRSVAGKRHTIKSK
jgi:hypothetical protein